MAKKKKTIKTNIKPQKFSVYDYFEQVKQSFISRSEVNHRDRNAPDYLKDLKKLAERNVQSSAVLVNHRKAENTVYGFKFENYYHKRRVSATTEYASIAAQKFGEKFPTLDIEQYFTLLCTEPFTFPVDSMENEGFVVLACAIFILDELVEACTMGEALFFIPNTEEMREEIVLPSRFVDSCHEDDVIKGLMYLIYHWCDDEKTNISPKGTFLNEKTVTIEACNFNPPTFRLQHPRPANFNKDGEEYALFLHNEASKMSYRQRLDTILSYMRPETISRAAQRFEEKFWEYTEIALKGISNYDKKYRECLSQALDAIKTAYSKRKLFDKTFDTEAVEELAPDNVMYTRNSPVLASNNQKNTSNIAAFSNMFSTSAVYSYTDFDKLVNEVNKSADALYDAVNEADTAEARINGFIAYITRGGIIPDDEYDAIFGSTLKSFHVINPIETCFTYFWLIFCGNNMPWLVGLTDSVVYSAYRNLPWESLGNSALTKILIEQASESETNTYEDRYQEIPMLLDYTEEEAKLYSAEYSDYISWYFSGAQTDNDVIIQQWSFPQLVYALTGVVLPRSVSSFDEFNEALIETGVSKENINFVKAYLTLCNEIRYKTSFNNLWLREEDDEKSDEESVESLKKLLSEKNNKIAELKSALHSVESKASQSKKSSEKMMTDYEADRQELIQLRELVYKLQNSAETESLDDPDESSITFPYTAKKNIVVYGGHESWRRNIKTLLNNVRFIYPEESPDPNLIRNADVVWMQSNAMPHSTYYKIMDIVRQRKIPLKYFAYSSAEKCARQLAADDCL